MRSVRIIDPGPLALVQDRGRPGHAHLGVPPSGVLDRPAAELANRLVGNQEPAAVIEVLLGGLRLAAGCSCTIAVTGPAVAASVDGHPVGSHAAVHLPAGAELALGVPATGMRNYLAISGGIDCAPELGSASTDLLSGIGPPALRAGTSLALGTPPGPPASVDVVPPPRIATEIVLPLLLGPRDDWFGASVAGMLTQSSWQVSPDSDRIGVRLSGQSLRRDSAHDGRELASEAVVTGAVQVPASGQPVVFLADHPTTGGYPVVGVVEEHALPLLAQARPGTSVRLRPVPA
jgi:biotin-dependent carboxylase-like uncharacterized protein